MQGMAWGQLTTFATYYFENNTNPESGAIGSPSLVNNSTSFQTSDVCQGTYSIEANADGDYVELTIATTGYENITIQWEGRYSGGTYGTATWSLTGDYGSGYGSTLTSQSLNTTCTLASYNLSSDFNNKSSIKLRITFANSYNRNGRLDELVIKGTEIDPSSACDTNMPIWSEPFTYNNFVTSGVGSPADITSWTSSGRDGNDYGVYVYNNSLNGYQTIDANPDRTTWSISSSNPIEIAGYTNISISVNLSENSNCDGTDYVQVQYKVDNGAWTNFETNGLKTDDFGSAIATQSGLAGNTLQLQIIFYNSGEDYYADNILVTGIPNPTVADPTDLIKCAEDAASVTFNGSSGATTYYWSNNNTSIGLAASGVGNISFATANVTTQQTATITILPSNGTCAGTPQTFTITVNPLPTATIANIGEGTSNVSCYGGTDGTVKVTASGGSGTDYEFWIEGAGLTGVWTTGAGNLYTFTGLKAEILYTVKVKDSNECISLP